MHIKTVFSRLNVRAYVLKLSLIERKSEPTTLFEQREKREKGRLEVED